MGKSRRVEGREERRWKEKEGKERKEGWREVEEEKDGREGGSRGREKNGKEVGGHTIAVSIGLHAHTLTCKKKHIWESGIELEYYSVAYFEPRAHKNGRLE